MLARRASVKCCPRQRYGSALTSRAYPRYGIEPSQQTAQGRRARMRPKNPAAFAAVYLSVRSYHFCYYHKSKKAQGRGARMRPKNPAAFAAGLFRMRSSFERGILRADESRPRSSIPSAVLARGKTKYARKRSAQNRILTRRPWATTQNLGQGLHRSGYSPSSCRH